MINARMRQELGIKVGEEIVVILDKVILEDIPEDQKVQ